MSEEVRGKLLSNAIAAIITALVGLLAFWFGSFATGASVNALEYRVNTLSEKSKTYAKKAELRMIMQGLCIINEKTCVLIPKDR